MTLLRRAEGRYSQTVIDQELVVMSLDSGEFFSLSGTARSVWDLLDGTRDRVMLLADLGRAHRVEERAIAPDVDAFLDQLRAARLIAD